MKCVILSSLLVFGISALPIPADGDIRSVYDILPDEVKQFYQDLTEEDAKTFESFQTSTLSANEVIAQIKQKNPVLWEKIQAMAKKVADKINTLSEEPKKYLNSIVAELKSARNVDPDRFGEEFVQTLSKGEKLSKGAQDEILKVFPSLKLLFVEETN